jgi:DNA-binding NarL/FixJ family response regulator
VVRDRGRVRAPDTVCWGCASELRVRRNHRRGTATGWRVPAPGGAADRGCVVTRVVVVDDEELFRSGLRMVVESHPGVDVVGEASDGAQAVSVVRELRPDVALMDIQMPLVNGIEATRRIVSRGLDTRVLMLTTFGMDRYVVESLRAGASGFLLKTVPADELLAGIATVARGESLLAPAILRRLLAEWIARWQPRRADGEDPREPDPGQDRFARPRAGRRAGVRDRPSAAR